MKKRSPNLRRSLRTQARDACFVLALVACTGGPRAASIAGAPRTKTTTPGPPEAKSEVSVPLVPTVDAGPPPGEAGDGRVALPEDFPEGTSSLKVLDLAHVQKLPHDRARYIGKITRGTRVAWQRVVAPEPTPPDAGRAKRVKNPCAAWVEIQPRGYLCKTLLAPSKEPPSGTRQPVVPPGKLVPERYFQVNANETRVFENPEAARAGTPVRVLSTKVMVVGARTEDVDGVSYIHTDHGLVEQAALSMFWPSDFEGRPLAGASTAGTPDVAWVFFERGARRPPVFADADPRAQKLRSAARREVLPILEERAGFVRVGAAEWIERKHLRILRLAPPPAGIGEGEQWLDVDLDEQTLVAYEGSRPVFATLVSTGGKRNATPPATYRVRAKAATTSMAGYPKVPNRYEVSAVPWAIRFGDGLYVHGVYWHDGFGGPRSHGCVNVSPKDAAFLYEWIEPAVPEGWSEVEVPGGEGAIIRVRNRDNPTPAPFDYSREEPWNYPDAKSTGRPGAP